VPPPPVCGAAVTTGVRDTVTVALGVAVLVTVAVAATVGVTVTVGVTATVGVTLTVGVTVTVGATVTVGVVARAEMPPVAVGRTEPLAVGANVVAAANGVDDDEQPDTVARPRTAMAPQPTAVSSARGVPAIGVRTLLRYPAQRP